MSILTCRGCGRKCNSALSDHIYEKEPGFATKCYAACIIGGGYVKGCGYDGADDFYKRMADHFITKKEE